MIKQHGNNVRVAPNDGVHQCCVSALEKRDEGARGVVEERGTGGERHRERGSEKRRVSGGLAKQTVVDQKVRRVANKVFRGRPDFVSFVCLCYVFFQETGSSIDI